ncbi:uncharacterized protein LOC114932726 [Nylanderia fulva]|uniref:uncharacterized protein LOC114932726 n=1 Tax=Nylanderia fulva TaxID=613905 RepID=UPI0010FB2896|nr:uncharacterized protein LOC114932726 [Nylanderia fulva]
MQPTRTIDNKTRELLNYSKQCAYKALKHLTLDKNLNFKPELWEETSKRSRASSTDRSIIDTDDKSDAVESESPESGTRSPESPFFREMQRRLRKTWAPNIGKEGIRYKLFGSSSARFSMIPAKSLARSGFSTKFGRYEIRESRSANVLSAIPKVSCFQRRNRDRCLSCMHKSLRETDEVDKAASSRTTSLTEIEARDDSESSSDELPEFCEELRKMSQRKKIPRYLDKIETASDKSTSSSHPMEQEDTSMSTKVESNQSKAKTAKPAESLLSKSPKSLKAISISMSVSSEPSKISSSHTSDDETSSPLALDDDPSRYKNMAPCHLPTIFVPNMEPLRALRHRKPTTMESRIAFMESTVITKEKSDDEYDDAKPAASKTSTEKLRSKQTDEKPERRLGEEKDMLLKKSPRTLLKVKSEQQLVIPSIVKSARKDELKRGYSCASIEDLSKDSARGTFEISRGEAEDGRGEVISSAEIDSAEESAFSDSGKRAELPLSTVAEISQFLEKASRKKDASLARMLEDLASEFASRLIKQHEHAGAVALMRRAKLTARLTKLLADSKRYSSPDKFPSDLIFSTQQPPACNYHLLRRVLPLDSYNLVAPLMGMPIWYPKRKVKTEVHYKIEGGEKEEEEEEQEEEEEEEAEGVIPFDLVVHPPTTKDSTKRDADQIDQARLNPYALFLKKPLRKVVTWRPLTADDLKGYDPEATLEMKAKNMTDRICRDFCEWLRNLGGTNKVIDEEVLGDMFEIDFTAEASRTMEMSIKEMPMVPNGVAAARQCPDAGELAMTRKHLIRDAKAESKPAKTMAFGTAIPWKLQFVPPGNRVRERWLRCENVMPDLETMDVVWEGITHLESVKAFAKWFGEHSNISLPDILLRAISTDLAKHNNTHMQPEIDVEQIDSLKVRGAQQNRLMA